MWAAALGDLFILGIYENRQGTCQSPDNPWAGCLTEILSYGVPFEKFSWCIRLEDFRIICTVSQGSCVCDVQEVGCGMLYHTILLVGCDVGGEKRDVVVRENLIYEESMVLK